MSDPDRPQFISSLRQWAKLSPKAHEMRQSPTPAEDALWQHLRHRQVGGAKFRRQPSVEGYIVDFICIEQHLIVGGDGTVHDQPDQKAWDQERQRVLEEKGFRVLRFDNTRVLADPRAVIEAIEAAITR